MGSPTDPNDGATLQPNDLASQDALTALSARVTIAEAKAAQLDEWFGVMFEDSPVAMSVISAYENRYVRVNRALEELFGRSREEIMSVDPFAFSFTVTHPDDLLADQALFG